MYWILEDGEPKKVDMETWARWFENTDNRRVGNTEVGDSQVSTVFLGLDHSFGADGPPQLFETLVFGGKHAGAQERCATMDEAKEMHANHVKMLEEK